MYKDSRNIDLLKRGKELIYSIAQLVQTDVEIGTRQLVYTAILTSNENATSKCTSISLGYIGYTFAEDFWLFYECKRQTQYWLY